MARRRARQRLWAGVVLALLSPLLAAGAVVAGAAEAPVGVIAVIAFTGGGVLVVSGVREELDEHRRGRVALARELSALLRTATPVPRVREVDPYGELAVFRSTLADRVTPEGERPKYVPQDNDGQLNTKLTDLEVGMVLVRGEASVGKKRSAYEALLTCWPDRPIIVPSRPSPATLSVLSRLAGLDVPLGADDPPILWLDNAEWWANAGDLEAGVSLLRSRYPGLLVVATLRFGAVPDPASARTTTDLLEARRADTVWRSLEAQPWVASHVVESGLSDRALRNFGAAYPDYADRMRQAGGIGTFFSGLDQLRRKLREGRGPTGHSPIGVALVRAAVDWRRSGLSRPAPDAVLRYLVTQERGRVTDQEFEEALSWVTTRVDSGARLLDPVEVKDDIGYRVTDGIYDDLAANRGHPATELEVVTRVGAAASSILGPDHWDTLASRSNIAHWTGHTGDPAEALRLYTDLLPDFEQVLGTDHRETLVTRGNIAHWTGKTGNVMEALRLCAELLRDCQRVLGRHHPDTLVTRGNVATWTGQNGDAKEALRLYIELLPDLQQVLDTNHASVLATRQNIAYWTGNAGNATEALRLYTELLPDLQRVLGPDHPDTLTTRNNIAAWTANSGDLGEALRLVRELLPERERALGQYHNDTLTTRSNRAYLTGETGNATEALRLYTELLPDCERVLGPHHPDTLTNRGNIAHWTGKTGNPMEALRLYTELLPDCERVLGLHHPDSLMTRGNIAGWTGEIRKPADALRLYSELLPDFQRTFGPHHPHTLVIRSNIARWTAESHNLHEAVRLYTELLPDFKHHLGHDHHLTRAVADQIERLRRELADRD